MGQITALRTELNLVTGKWALHCIIGYRSSHYNALFAVVLIYYKVYRRALANTSQLKIHI